MFDVPDAIVSQNERDFLYDCKKNIAVYRLKNDPAHKPLLNLELAELAAHAEDFRKDVCKELYKLSVTSASNGYAFDSLDVIMDELTCDGFMVTKNWTSSYPISVRNAFMQEIQLRIGLSMERSLYRIAHDLLKYSDNFSTPVNDIALELAFFAPPHDRKLYLYGYSMKKYGLSSSNYDVVLCWEDHALHDLQMDHDDVQARLLPLLSEKAVSLTCGDIIAIRPLDKPHSIQTYFVCKDGHLEEVHDFVHDPLEKRIHVLEEQAKYEHNLISGHLSSEIAALEQEALLRRSNTMFGGGKDCDLPF